MHIFFYCVQFSLKLEFSKDENEIFEYQKNEKKITFECVSHSNFIMYVFIKSIRMLDTLLFSINEIETITKKSIRSNSKSLQQCIIAILFSQCSRRSRLSKFSFIFYFALISFCFRDCWNALSRNELIRRFSKIFVVISSKTARCWKCKDDTWSLMWHDVAKTTFDVWKLTLDNFYR